MMMAMKMSYHLMPLTRINLLTQSRQKFLAKKFYNNNNNNKNNKNNNNMVLFFQISRVLWASPLTLGPVDDQYSSLHRF